MDHQIPDDVPNYVDQQWKLKKCKTSLDSKEIYLHSDWRSPEEIVFINPVKDDKSENEQNRSCRYQQPIKRYGIGKHYIKCIFLCEIKLRVLVQFVELNLEQF